MQMSAASLFTNGRDISECNRTAASFSFSVWKYKNLQFKNQCVEAALVYGVVTLQLLDLQLV